MSRQTARDAWAKSSVKTKELDVPELGATVRIRELPAAYSADLSKYVRVKNEDGAQFLDVDEPTLQRLQLLHGVVDEDLSPIWDTEEEVTEVVQRHGSAVKRVVAEIVELTEFDPDAVEAEEARFPGGSPSETPEPQGSTPAGDG